MRILLIEDTEHRRAELVKQLDEFSPVGVGSASEALQLLKNMKFDVIFTDVNLPGLDGFEFAKELRKSDTKTPILIYTSQFEAPAEFEDLAERYKAKFIRTNPIKMIYEAISERLRESIIENQIVTSK